MILRVVFSRFSSISTGKFVLSDNLGGREFKEDCQHEKPFCIRCHTYRNSSLNCMNVRQFNKKCCLYAFCCDVCDNVCFLLQIGNPWLVIEKIFLPVPRSLIINAICAIFKRKKKLIGRMRKFYVRDHLFIKFEN